MPHLLQRHVQHDPAGVDEPVQPSTIAEKRLPLGVPEPVVLDRDLQVRIGEIDPPDQALGVEHPELRDGRGHSRPLEEQSQPGLRG